MNAYTLILTCAIGALTLNAFSQDHKYYRTVDQMPATVACDESNNALRRSCTVDEIQMQLILNIDMTEAEMSEIKGRTLMIRFVIDKDGKITSPEVLGGARTSAEQRILEAVRMLPDMQPGKHNGENCEVLYVIPFRMNS